MARLLGRSAPTSSLDLSDIGRVLRDLERGVSQLAAFVSANAREAGSGLPDRFSDAWSDISDRMGSIRHNALSVGEGASRMSSGALQRIENEIVHRPLVALAIAAGIGFLIGALNRR
jgi:ElaB/YqjD/DUF883 family membrane-anchored ribosome-binding protein